MNVLKEWFRDIGQLDPLFHSQEGCLKYFTGSVVSELYSTVMTEMKRSSAPPLLSSSSPPLLSSPLSYPPLLSSLLPSSPLLSHPLLSSPTLLSSPLLSSHPPSLPAHRRCQAQVAVDTANATSVVTS